MQRGCRCSPVENRYGRGVDNGYTLVHQVATYVIAETCSLHAQPKVETVLAGEAES